MTTENLSFHFELSPAELHWLSGAFGFMHLPLTSDSISRLSLEPRKDAIRSAQDSLQHRNLIHRVPGQGWQVDRLPAAIVRWLGSATTTLLLDYYSHSQVPHQAQIFTESERIMHITVEEDKYCFLFLPDRQALIHYLLDQFGASLQNHEPAATKFTLPQPVTVFRSAWTDSALAAKMLKVIQFETKEIKSLLTWAGSLEWVVTLKQAQIEAKAAGKKRQAVLCGNEKGYWAGELDGDVDSPVTLSPVNMEKIRALIYSLL
jgi:hypothetical protein